MLEWLPYLIVTVILMMGSFLIWVGSKLLPVIRKGTRVLDDFLGEPARPGIPARPGVIEALAGTRHDLDLVKKQVQNSHKTNFRDDLDGKASKEDVEAVAKALTTLASKLDEHITIAKESDRSQVEMARQMERIAGAWTTEN